MPLKGVGRMVEYEDSELTFLYEHTKTTTIYRLTISENYLKRRFSATKAIRKKPQQDDRKGTVTIKSNPIPTRWVAHKPQNNNP